MSVEATFAGREPKRDEADMSSPCEALRRCSAEAPTPTPSDPGSILRSNYVKPRFFIDIFEGPEKRV